MKKQLTLAALAVSALALTACGSSSSDEAPVEVTPVEVKAVPTETPEPTVEDNLTERGNMPMELGDTGTLTTFEDKKVVDFTVNSIKPLECTQEFYEGPENGTMYAVDLSLVTTKDTEPHSLNFNGFSWKFISTDGTTFNGDLASMATFSCLPESELLPDAIGPGEKMTGLVVLDLPDTEGTLVVTPDYANGFEYAL